MSMIKCPECGLDISDKAKSCPQCGCPISDNVCIDTKTKSRRVNKLRVFIVGLIVLVVLIGSFAVFINPNSAERATLNAIKAYKQNMKDASSFKYISVELYERDLEKEKNSKYADLLSNAFATSDGEPLVFIKTSGKNSYGATVVSECFMAPNGDGTYTYIASDNEDTYYATKEIICDVASQIDQGVSRFKIRFWVKINNIFE